MKSTATARVQVTLNVELGQGWSADCPVGQVRTQAMMEAREAVERIIRDVHGMRIQSIASLDIVISEAP
jgi:hypothetical protein